MSALHRREIVKALLADRGSTLVIAGLGSTAWDCTAAGDSPLTFPLWGAMGVAAMVGLGVALAQLTSLLDRDLERVASDALLRPLVQAAALRLAEAGRSGARTPVRSGT